MRLVKSNPSGFEVTVICEKVDSDFKVSHEVLQFKDVLLKDLEHLVGTKTILGVTATRIHKHKI
jgi:hypothetical protein|tara:strand:- start:1240 stop:1431 length:192 start_codon:yes stop_codon:yes gene_type:complete